MANFQVHFSNGLVGQAGLSPERPLLIGSHQRCDLVITDAGVAAVHCRIVYHAGCYRVEVVSTASVELNDRPVRSGALQSGDQLRLGDAILVFEGDPAPAGAAARPQALPVSSPLDALFDSFDHGASEPEAIVRRGSQPSARRGRAQAAAPPPPPGQERLLRSPLFLGLAGGFAVLLILGVVFFVLVRQRGAEISYDAALKSMEDGAYAAAVRQFDRFLADYPRHANAEVARVYRGLCNVRQFTEGAAPAPAQALQAARQLLESAGNTRTFASIRKQLADVMASVARSLAESARDQADAPILSDAEDARRLHERFADEAPKDQDQWAALVEAARASLRRREQLEAALKAMDDALAAGDLSATYRRHEELTLRYPELTSNDALQGRIRQAVQADQAAAHWQPGRPESSPALATAEAAGPVAASTILAARKQLADGGAALQNDVVFCLVAGACYALDAQRGTVLWRRFIGTDARALPQLIDTPDGRMAIVGDAHRNELLAVETRTGRPHWRQPLGEAPEGAPFIRADRIFVATAAGRLWALDLHKGTVIGTLKLSQGLAAAPLAGRDNRLYAVARQAVVYALSADAAKCEAVYHLGQGAESMRGRPVMLGEYLFVAENHALHSSRLRVLECSAETLREVQQMPLDGWITQPLAARGNVVWAATDAGAVYALQVNPANRTQPVTLAGSATDPARASVEGYLFAASEQELWIAQQSVQRLRLSVQQQQLSVDWRSDAPGAAVQEVQTRGAVLFFARQHPAHPGVIMTAVETETQRSLWEIELGAGIWAVLDAAEPAASADGGTTLLTRSGSLYALPPAAADHGVLDQPLVRWFDEPARALSADTAVSASPQHVVAGAVGAREVMVWPRASSQAPSWLDLPFSLSASPQMFEGALLLSGGDQLHLVSAETGEPLAAAFQPPLNAQQPTALGQPISVAGGRLAVAAGVNLYLLRWRRGDVAHFAPERSRNFERPLTQLAALQNVIYGIDQAATLVALSADDLTTIGQWPLEAVNGAPEIWIVGEHLLAVSSGKEVLCLNGQGVLRWRAAHDHFLLAGPPVVVRDHVWLVGRDGRLTGFRLHDGAVSHRAGVGEPLSAAFATHDARLVVAALDGTLLELSLPEEASR